MGAHTPDCERVRPDYSGRRNTMLVLGESDAKLSRVR
jgi:hypothetical protein